MAAYSSSRGMQPRRWGRLERGRCAKWRLLMNPSGIAHCPGVRTVSVSPASAGRESSQGCGEEVSGADGVRHIDTRARHRQRPQAPKLRRRVSTASSIRQRPSAQTLPAQLDGGRRQCPQSARWDAQIPGARTNLRGLALPAQGRPCSAAPIRTLPPSRAAQATACLSMAPCAVRDVSASLLFVDAGCHFQGRDLHVLERRAQAARRSRAAPRAAFRAAAARAPGWRAGHRCHARPVA